VLRRALRGYDRRAVDALLARCAASLGPRRLELPELRDVRPADGHLPRVDAGDVRAARFAVVPGGYDRPATDALLARVAALLPQVDSRPAWAAAPAGLEPVPLRLPRTLRGYDIAEVDAFLLRCAHSLGPGLTAVPELAGLLGQPPTGEPVRARDVEQQQFRIRGLRRAYDVAAVDALLDRVQRALCTGRELQD
jgi:DivIVA domain-containing protein